MGRPDNEDQIMKTGIDSYCFHRFFGEVYEGQPEPSAKMTMTDFLAFAVELGVDGVSLESCFSKHGGIVVPGAEGEPGRPRAGAGLCVGHPQGLEDGSNRAALEDMISQIDNAKSIGAKVMRVVPGPGPGDYRYAPASRGWTSWPPGSRSGPAAGPRGVRLAAENHGDYTAREMLWLVEAVGSPYFGVNFDSGNFLRLLDDPLSAMKLLRPYVFATHIKDLKVRRDVPASEWYFFSSTPVGEGLIDMGELIRLLADGGYDGLLAVE